jgi:putative addiction module component (TIGR02574 family)
MADPAKVLDEALALAPIERAGIARALIESLEEADEGASESWRHELRRRIDELDGGHASLEDWAEVRRKLRASVER